MVQAACKKYKHASDQYLSKPLLYNPYERDHGHDKVVYVPRIAPPRNKLELLVRRIEAKCGVQSMENGRLAFKSFEMMLNQLLHQDPGHGDMPPLSFFAGGAAELPIVISLDATGFGTQQFNTVAMRNPYLSRSAQHLRVFGLGNCSDDRAGSTRLLGPNLGTINEAIQYDELITCIPCEDGEPVVIRPRVFAVFDVSALRHCEHVANSGWCACSREKALRIVPSKPETVQQMYEQLKECHSPSLVERFILSHNPLPGQEVARPCTAPGCTFGHGSAEQTLAEMAALQELYNAKAADKSKSGKAAFSKWRMTHAHAHYNIQPGPHGKPMFHHDFQDQILDPLHLAELGVPKTPWKYGVLNNCSEDAS